MTISASRFFTHLCRAFLCVILLAGIGAAQTFFTEVTEESDAPSFASNGIAVGDFDNDGWPDMAQVQDWTEGQRVFLLRNEGNGRFTDASAAIRSNVSPMNKGGGICFADYDNDGDLDLFVPVGFVGSRWADRDMLLRNDQGLFTDVAEEAELTDVMTSFDATWLDYDRDGNVDIYVAHYAVYPNEPELRNRLYRNRGDGTFEDVTERAGLDIQFSDAGGSVGGIAAADFDDDGWPDLYIANTNEPDGRRIAFVSERDGNREVYVMNADGSNPVNLTNHPADDIDPTWSPDGTHLSFSSDRDGNAEIYAMDADGSAVTRLTEDSGSDRMPTWSPDGAKIAFVSERDGNREVYVMDADGSDPVNLTNHPADDIDPAWSPDGEKIAFGSYRLGTEEIFVMDVSGRDVELVPVSGTQVDRSGTVLEVRAGTWWTIAHRPAAPLDIVGYDALRFAFHPGDAMGGTRFSATIGGSVSLLGGGKGVDLSRKEWQIVEIPFAEFGLEGAIEEIVFSGDFTGTFYIDDVQLVAARPSAGTAVEEERVERLPQTFSLDQNYPNPFNSGTAIRFALPTRERIRLSAYNLLGQQVATLAEGMREAGTHTVRWDGRDGDGRELASGVYLYRLQAGKRQVETRKLALIR